MPRPRPALRGGGQHSINQPERNWYNSRLELRRFEYGHMSNAEKRCYAKGTRKALPNERRPNGTLLPFYSPTITFLNSGSTRAAKVLLGLTLRPHP